MPPTGSLRFYVRLYTSCMSLWHTMIALHALAGLVCFVTGYGLLFPHRVQKHTWLLPTFLISLAGLVVFMVGALASHWQEIDSTQRTLFTGLIGLGLFMLYRGWRAKRLLSEKNVSEHYIDDVGFTLISLFDGFIIVGLLDLHAPVWLTIGGAILGVYGGIQIVNAAKRRFHSQHH